MSIVEISILYICGALGMQNYIRGIKTVWWKEVIGILLWPLVMLYILGGIIYECYKTKWGR